MPVFLAVCTLAGVCGPVDAPPPGWADEVARERVRYHEGLRYEPYRGINGHLTVGYGHKIDPSDGITPGARLSPARVEALFQVDWVEARRGARTLFAEHDVRLDSTRAGVVAEMVFQMGRAGVRRFGGMWAALRESDYARAAGEMVNSRWCRQTTTRCLALVEIFAGRPTFLVY